MVQQNVLSVRIGEQVRTRREQRGMSAAELSRRAGLSKATLSGLEAGRANPTIDTLDAVAQALGIPLADILDAPTGSATVHVPAQPLTDEPVQRHLLHRVPGGHQVETWRLRMLPGAAFSGVPHAHGTIEELVCTAGSLTAGRQGDERELAPGDCLVFDGTGAHGYTAGPDGADVVVILTSPTA